MTETLDPKHAWLRDALGVAVPESGPPKKAQKFSFGSVTEAFTELGSKLKALFTGASSDKKSSGLRSGRLGEDLDYQKEALKQAALLPDEGKRKEALERINRRLQEIESHAAALDKAHKSVMGDIEGTPDETQRSKIFEKALKDHYGLKITVPKGMSNTHFDRVFDMLGTVPRAQVNHGKLKKLTYLAGEKDKGSGAYGSAEIDMGDFGSASKEEAYSVDGVTMPANSFDVTMLHEMGHALDDAKGIMNKLQGRSGCGGWKPETRDSTATVMAQAFQDSVTVSVELTPSMVLAVIKDQLGGSSSRKPDAVDEDDWNALMTFVVDKVNPSMEDNEPWFNPPPSLGGRCYLEAYSGEWWSYEHAAVAKTKVNSYQWRSPAEWFAEVYAISWLKRTKPQSGVDAEVATYMWQA